MDKEQLEALVADAVRDADLSPHEIPSIDLYLDQITSLMTEKLQEGSARFRDRVLTKTMINNYSKDGLISPVKGKKYTKTQILQMLLVYELKNTLSIGEIKRILQNIYARTEFDSAMLEQTYSRFLEMKELERESAWDLLQKFIEKSELNPETERDFFLLILGLASMSSYLKNIVQVLLEEHYPDPSAEKAKGEQAEREVTKRQKEEKRIAEKQAKQAQIATDKKDAAESEGTA